MFKSLVGKLAGFAWWSEEDAGGEHYEEVTIPKLRTGFLKRDNTKDGKEPDWDLTNVPKDKEEEPVAPRADVERMDGVGCITAIDLSMNLGIIDRFYRFQVDRFTSTGGPLFERGNRVQYVAERSLIELEWRVISMTLVPSKIQTGEDNVHRIRKEIVTVKKVNRSGMQIELGAGETRKPFGKKTGDPRVISIPFNNGKNGTEFFWMRGDWLVICFEDLEDKHMSDDNVFSHADTGRCRILSLEPLSVKKVVGRVTCHNQECLLIDNTILYEPRFCSGIGSYCVGATVHCVAIESTQNIGGLSLKWRATKVRNTSSLHGGIMSEPYSGDPDENFDTEGKVDGGNHVNENEDLFRNKYNMEIHPRNLSFPPTLIGTSSSKKFRVRNRSSEEVCLKTVRLSQDEAHSQFVVQLNLEHSRGMTIRPNQEYPVEIVCHPRMIGKTKEICVFDFGDFRIGCQIFVTGFSKEEQEMLGTKNKARQVQPFNKETRQESIENIIADRGRRIVKGNRVVRSPFFIDNKILANYVPDELYEIVKNKDERLLMDLYPEVFRMLHIDAYKKKFQVGLWFEEIESQMRRRKQDLRNVQLIRVKRSVPHQYKFICVGILEFQPPVHVNDTITVFDSDDPDHSKFEGCILQLSENEVTCSFGGNFDTSYTGFPLTVQFKLGRSQFKRCHFAVEAAVGYLGEGFLFPEDEVVTKVPRILTFETETPGCSTNSKASLSNGVVGNASSKKLSQLPPLQNSDKAQAPSVSSNSVSRRAPSLKSRFVSKTASNPSTNSTELVWFNNELNKEQKNAVRRILRGQARPIPYIIFGPPGTGKTVTLVEAVMQVNKLDTNSRILVCAPSNAAADIVAEYLMRSNQYIPGDFVRLNGFLRAEQGSPEFLQPFCVNGDDIGNVAMHRLIVSTCATAGQFFSLGLDHGHFTHVFVDEAGYCTEPETMVPAILVAVNKGGQLILSGDPKQLGPVLMSNESKFCGLNVSLLERLMNRKLYQIDTDRFGEEKYNPLVLTMLRRNYRTHATLLKLPSKLFYDDELFANASHKCSYALVEDVKVEDALVRQGVPMVFHGVSGKCVKDKNSLSSYNIPEAMQVAKYVNTLVLKCGLTSEDIGIITPYRKQVEKIRDSLALVLAPETIQPKVASVEEFQGGERPVIIISTVRSSDIHANQSNTDRYAFLFDPKRFNVMITRPKSLLIIVGNPHVLALNTYWRQLLEYAIELKVYIGCHLPASLDTTVAKICSTMAPAQS